MRPDEIGDRRDLSTVDVCTLDDKFTARVDLVKIDVEGNGLAVFEGAVATLARWRPAIIFERRPPDDVAAVFDFLTKRAGYDVIFMPFSGSTESRWTSASWRIRPMLTLSLPRILISWRSRKEPAMS